MIPLSVRRHGTTRVVGAVVFVFVFVPVFFMGALPARVEAGAWVLPKGRANIQIALLHQDTTERYFLDGERIPYFFDGHNRTSAVYIDGHYGLTDRLEGVVQVPFFLLRFDALSDDRRSNGCDGGPLARLIRMEFQDWRQGVARMFAEDPPHLRRSASGRP